MKRTNSVLRHALDNRKRDILFFFVLLTGLGLLVGFSNRAAFSFGSLDSWWAAWLDPIIGVGTFSVAIFVWLGELRENWEDELPRRLTVRFVLLQGDSPPRIAMICREADLTSQADIRQWGQQIGKQMSGNRQLALEIYFDLKAGEPSLRNEGWYKPYYLQLYLTEFPLKGDKVAEGYFAEGRYLLWERESGRGHYSSWREWPFGNLPSLEKTNELWEHMPAVKDEL